VESLSEDARNENACMWQALWLRYTFPRTYLHLPMKPMHPLYTCVPADRVSTIYIYSHLGCDGVVTNCHILFTVRQTPICVNIRMCVYDEYVCIPVSYPAVLIPIYHPNVAIVVVVVVVVVLVVDTYKRYI